MPQWEYQTLEVRASGGSNERKLDEQLNQMALQGWELFWVAPARYRFPTQSDSEGPAIMMPGMDPSYAVTNLWVFRRAVTT